MSISTATIESGIPECMRPWSKDDEAFMLLFSKHREEDRLVGSAIPGARLLRGENKTLSGCYQIWSANYSYVIAASDTLEGALALACTQTHKP